MNNLLFWFLFFFMFIFIQEVVNTSRVKTKEHYENQQSFTSSKETISKNPVSKNPVSKKPVSKKPESKEDIVNKQLEAEEKKMEQIKREMEEIQKKKKTTSFEEKEKAYLKNLEEQQKIEESIKQLEKARNKEFEIQYQEATKIEKEIGSLKNEITRLKEQLESCKKDKQKSKNKSSKEDDKSIVQLEKSPEEPIDEKKPIIQNSVDKNLVKSQSVKNEMEYLVGCNKDSDCNIFYGEGKNICKSNHQCRCEVGSGELCQYGPTKFKDPKDMTKKEKEIFKHLSNYDNFTIQDYKNWLGLYKKDYYLLSDEHLINLRKILRGEPIRLRDIPTSGIFPPDTSQRYFSEMYDKLTNAEKIVAPINSSTTGNQVGYNYMDYSDFSKPESLGHLKVVNGEIERKYRRPSAKNKIWPAPLKNSMKTRQDTSSGMPILLEDAIGPFQENPNI